MFIHQISNSLLTKGLYKTGGSFLGRIEILTTTVEMKSESARVYISDRVALPGSSASFLIK